MLGDTDDLFGTSIRVTLFSTVGVSNELVVTTWQKLSEDGGLKWNVA